MPRRLVHPRLALLAGALAGAAFAACRDLPFEPQDPTRVTYATSLGINLSQFQTAPGGTYYRDVAVGSGALVESTSTVGTIYKGYLADGRVFDSTLTNTPRAFALPAVTAVGFRNGLVGARQGSRRVLVLPPSQGYGNRTTADNRIPAGSVLIFDINVVSVTPPPPTTTTSRAGAE